jgi:hypothetical protein
MEELAPQVRLLDLGQELTHEGVLLDPTVLLGLKPSIPVIQQNVLLLTCPHSLTILTINGIAALKVHPELGGLIKVISKGYEDYLCDGGSIRNTEMRLARSSFWARTLTLEDAIRPHDCCPEASMHAMQLNASRVSTFLPVSP